MDSQPGAVIPSATRLSDLIAAVPMVLEEVAALGREMRAGRRSLEQAIRVEGATNEQREETVGRLDELAATYRRAEALREAIASRTRRWSAEKREALEAELRATDLRIRTLLHGIPFSGSFVKRLAHRLSHYVGQASSAEEEAEAVTARLGLSRREVRALLERAGSDGAKAHSARRRLSRAGLADLPRTMSVLARPKNVSKRIRGATGLRPGQLSEVYEGLVRAARVLERRDAWDAKRRTRRERPDRTAATRESGGRAEDPAVRRAVELYAMARAVTFYEARGYIVEDTSRTHPFDLRCHRPGEEVRVEVKGTRGDGAEVLVTAGEVESARHSVCRTDLFILSRIQVATEGAVLVGAGGQERVVQRWRPDDAELIPTQFRWIVSGADGD